MKKRSKSHKHTLTLYTSLRVVSLRSKLWQRTTSNQSWLRLRYCLSRQSTRRHCKICYSVGIQLCLSSSVSATSSWRNGILFLAYPPLSFVFIYHIMSRKRLSAPEILYSEHDFLSPPNNLDYLLPYTINWHTRGIVPYHASRPTTVFYPADVSLPFVHKLSMLMCRQRRKFDASTQTAGINMTVEDDHDKTLADIGPINNPKSHYEGSEVVVKKRKHRATIQCSN